MRFSYSVDMPTSSALLAQDKSSAELTPLNRQSLAGEMISHYLRPYFL
jgi:hypothetical protein